MASPAMAQTAPPTDTSQSPAPGTNATDVTAPPPATQQAQDGEQPDTTEIIVTAQKREENLQNVPISVTAIGTRRLDQLNISNFEDYTKQLPSVSYQTAGPGFTTVYMRGIATGGDGNHSGSLPSVGSYLDEQPITTIGGTLDVHIYDIARIESLAGPQGTLYGASSQAGTIRIITNKPELGVTAGRIDGELNTVAHGGVGGNLEGMINLPVSDNIAFRGVAFYQKDAGYIDNVFGERTYRHEGGDLVFNNQDVVENNFNGQYTYGGRAALKIDLDENWTITPTIMHQYAKSHGVFFMDADQGDLEVQRFRPETTWDKFTQYALTVEGKIANFDVTYAGAYMHRPNYATSDYTDYTDAYEAYYNNFYDIGLVDQQAYVDNAGNTIDPRQHIKGKNNFRKMSQELRVASPQDKPIRLLAGAFYQKQKNDIYQDYMVDNLADAYSVDGWPGTIWLTKQKRQDKDTAIFGELYFDVTPKITLTAGGRYYWFDNTLFGFAGFGSSGGPGGFSSGYKRCLTVNGEEFRDDPLSPFPDNALPDTPCANVANVVNGKYVPRESKGHGFIHKLNAQWKPQEGLMFYATWSRGFRPGGINRQPEAPPYDPDFLTNYELGWKTQFGPVRWNGAIYHQLWKGIQFSFLGANSLTVIQNGREAKSDGIETDVNYVSGGLTLNAAAAYTNAKTKGNICNFAFGNSDCSGLDDGGDPDYIVTPSGTRLPVTPKFKGSATARYTWPIWAGRAHVQGSISYQGSASSDIRQNIGTIDDQDVPINPNDALGRIKSATLVDLFAGYEWGKYSIELFGTNIFDDRNELSRFTSCNSAYCYRLHIVPGRPRTLGVRVGTHF
jgi:outer membrane receptor protein involved in Fe transport